MIVHVFTIRVLMEILYHLLSVAINDNLITMRLVGPDFQVVTSPHQLDGYSVSTVAVASATQEFCLQLGSQNSHKQTVAHHFFRLILLFPPLSFRIVSDSSKRSALSTASRRTLAGTFSQ